MCDRIMLYLAQRGAHCGDTENGRRIGHSPFETNDLPHRGLEQPTHTEAQRAHFALVEWNT